MVDLPTATEPPMPMMKGVLRVVGAEEGAGGVEETLARLTWTESRRDIGR